MTRRELQKKIRSKAGLLIRDVRTKKVPGDPEVLAIVVLEDGTELYVTRVSKEA